MAGRAFARRLLVAGTVVWFVRSAVAKGETKPAPLDLPDDVPEAAVVPPTPTHAFRKRLATSLVFSALFFAGAAFTAGAGNELAQIDPASTDPAAPVAAAPVASATDTTVTDTTSTVTAAPAPVDVTPADPAPTAAASTDPAAALAAAPVASATDITVTGPAPTLTAAPAPADVTPADPAPTTDAGDALVVPSSTPVVAPTPPAITNSPAVSPSSTTRTTRPAPAHHARRAVAKVQAAPAVVAPLAPIPLAAIAFRPKVWLHDNPASTTGASAVAIAMHYLGVPYVWGGAIPATGFDCSGLTRFVYAQLGVNLPHYAAYQFADFPKLDPSQLEPGDLVFFEPKFDGPGHVALYIGNDQMIEAPHTGAVVRISTFSDAAELMGFLGAVRPYTPVVTAPLVTHVRTFVLQAD